VIFPVSEHGANVLVSHKKAPKSFLFITGTRADFGKIEPLAEILRDHGFGVSFFITGMHMMKKYGETRLEVRRFRGARFFEFVNQREGDPLDLVLSKTILGFSDFVRENKPDLVVIHGDRIEATAASLVCALSYVRSAHIEGGEVSGTIDELLRHCNTKLSTYHFVSSPKAAAVVRRLGEDTNRIFTIGSPELDKHIQPSGTSLDEVRLRYDIPFDEYGILIFHPVTSEQATIGLQIQSITQALIESGKNYVVIAPNNDPGSEEIFNAYSLLDQRRFRIIPSMRFSYFSELLRNAQIMVGNSSAGVREAPFLGVPSIDIGSRQKNRAENLNLHWCDSLDSGKLCAEILEIWGRTVERNNDFGHGSASLKFLSAVTCDRFWDVEFQKGFD